MRPRLVHSVFMDGLASQNTPIVLFQNANDALDLGQNTIHRPEGICYSASVSTKASS